jgi:hypothetical protein
MNNNSYPPEHFTDDEQDDALVAQALIQQQQAEAEAAAWDEQELEWIMCENESICGASEATPIAVEYSHVPGYEYDDYNHHLDQLEESEENYYNAMAESEGWEEGYDY